MDNQNPQSTDLNSPDIKWGAQPQNAPDLNSPNIQWGKPGMAAPNEPATAPAKPDLMQGVKDISGVAAGIGEGLSGTLAGVTDLAHKIPLSPLGPLALADKLAGGKISSTLHGLASGSGENGAPTKPEEFGQDVETIGEFLLTDAALKGLSVADKLTQVSKVMKYIEKSPKLAQTLRLGINVGKAGIELGPEERAILQKYPVLARLAGVGMDAIRHGTIQGAQTLAKTDGDIEEAAKSGGTMALGSAFIGAPLGIAGGLLDKVGQAADTVNDVRTGLQGNAPTQADVEGQLKQTTENAVAPQINAAQQAQQEAEERIAGAASVPESLAANAPTNEAITSSTQKAVKAAHTNLMNSYGVGLDSLKNVAQGQTLNYADSPLQKAAQSLLDKGSNETKPLDAAFDVNRPGSEKANHMLSLLNDPYEDENEESIADAKKLSTDGAKVPASIKTLETHPVKLDMQELVDRRKKVGELLRNTGWQTDEQRADRNIYKTLLQGTDDSIQQLVEKSGNPDAIQTLQKMNNDYRTGIRRFDNNDVQALLRGDANDVAKRLMGGGTSVNDINTVRDTIGSPAFKQLADSSIQRMAADAIDKTTGQFSFDAFFKNWNRIPSDVRTAMFQDSMKAGSLQNAIMQVQKTNASGVIPESLAQIKAATDTVSDILGNGSIDSLLKDPERVQNLAQLVGPEAMSDLGKTVLQNQLREASTDGTGNIKNVNTDKFLKFVASLKDSPEVVDALFRPTPETAAAYDKLLASIHNVSRVKEMVKLGIITPTIGAAIGGAIGHTGFSLVLGAAATEAAGGSVSFARDMLDRIANSPQTWNTLKFLDTAAKSKIAGGISKLGRYAAGKTARAVGPYLKNIYSQTGSSLGGTTPNSPVTPSSNQSNSFFESAGASTEPGALVMQLPKEIQTLVDKYANKYSVPTNLARAVIFHESSGNPNATGKTTSKGQAKGLGQLLPHTAEELGVTDPFDPDQNLNGSLKYLSRLYKKYGHDPLLAYAAYTSGPNRVQPGESIQSVIKKLPAEGQAGVKRVAHLMGIDINPPKPAPKRGYGVSGSW